MKMRRVKMMMMRSSRNRRKSLAVGLLYIIDV